MIGVWVGMLSVILRTMYHDVDSLILYCMSNENGAKDRDWDIENGISDENGVTLNFCNECPYSLEHLALVEQSDVQA